jgi:hypothetical protein
MGPIKRPEVSMRDRVVASSREQFSIPRDVVEKSIASWFVPEVKSRESAPKRDVPRQETPRERKEDNRPQIKEVFARAAEELKQKEPQRDMDRPMPPAKPKIDNHTAKKNPSRENVTSLKDALSAVIKNSTNAKAGEEVKPVEKPRSAESASPKPVEKPVDRPTPTTPNEIPEDVLRDMLK